MSKMKKICFVVHRYAPYPGGSEYYVQQMAEECVSRNYDVTVVAGEHCGDLNGVRVTSQGSYLIDQDLVVVHGGDVGLQNFVLSNAKNINSPMLYMIIKPSNSSITVQALSDVKYIGCSAPEDWEHVKKWKQCHKAHRITHGISPTYCIGTTGSFKSKYNIPKDMRMFLSCGGYWPNKKMKELAVAFQKAELKDAILVTTGYDNRHDIMPPASENVIPLMVEDPKDIKNAIVDADCYVMNSSEEGFGLVILESMINKTPWISRNIAGARLLAQFGTVYDTEDQLVQILKTWQPQDEEKTTLAYEHITQNHLIKNTVDDIVKLI
jgi:glycosyltransferase involved in cell wall biosynthesis